MANSSFDVTPLEPGASADGTAEAPPISVVGEIAVTDVKKYFDVTRALDGCTFTALLGEIHAIVGGNGSGKSTLAKVISGVLPADSGQVSVLGHAPSSPHEARALGIATVFQEVLVADECSVVDNLFLGGDGLWASTASRRMKAEAARDLMAELTGEDVDVNALVGTLPLSVKQWVTIGRALLSRPRVLILDESSAALDRDSTERLFAKMRELRDQGAAVLFVTHRIAELIRISDRATVLRDGRDVGVLEKEDISERNLLNLMTGKSEPSTLSTAVVREIRASEVVFKADNLKIWPTSEAFDFELRRGEIVGIAGLEGQGQGDFVKILAGLAKPAQSRPSVRTANGGFAEIKELADAEDHGIGYVSGDRKREGIFASLSIFENLLMPLYRRTARAGAVGIIDWGVLGSVFEWEASRLAIRMGDRADPITSLSGGNQQKVLIGRAFARNPEILILNDPARGVDVGAKSELYKHLTAYAARGRSVVYLSSEIEEFVGFCSRVIVFRHGSIFDEFSGSAINPALILEAMFGQSAGAGRQRDGGGEASLPRTDTQENLSPVLRIGRIKIVDFGADDDASRIATKPGPDSAKMPVPPPQQSAVDVGRLKIVEFPLEDGRRRPDQQQAPKPFKIVEFDRGPR
jgi:ribose transport system ATP-binding protein